MLLNPFTPSQIASDPNNFFGRKKELDEIESLLKSSSVAIQGIVGIGKSSLAYQACQRMAGFNSENNATYIGITHHKDLDSLDDIARAVITRLIDQAQSTKTQKFRLPILPVLEIEKKITINHLKEGQYLTALLEFLCSNRLKESDPNNLFIIWIDEAHTNPALLADFVRNIISGTQNEGNPNVRFLLSGVQPFYSELVSIDSGLLRFVPRLIDLKPLTYDESIELLESKFFDIIRDAKSKGSYVDIHPEVIPKIAQFAAGNPSLLQLIGSRVITSEDDDNDGIIDKTDLINAFIQVCYTDRDAYYREILKNLEDAGMVRPFAKIFWQLSKTFPSRIRTTFAIDLVGMSEINWLQQNNILIQVDDCLIFADQMLPVRIRLDRDQVFNNQREFEESLVSISELLSGEEENRTIDEELWEISDFEELWPITGDNI